MIEQAVVRYVDHFTPLTELKQELNRRQTVLDQRRNEIIVALKKLTDEKEFISVEWQELEEQIADICKTQSHMSGILARWNKNPLTITVKDIQAVSVTGKIFQPVPPTGPKTEAKLRG